MGRDPNEGDLGGAPAPFLPRGRYFSQPQAPRSDLFPPREERFPSSDRVRESSRASDCPTSEPKRGRDIVIPTKVMYLYGNRSGHCHGTMADAMMWFPPLLLP